jgi:hypothetical protein
MGVKEMWEQYKAFCESIGVQPSKNSLSWLVWSLKEREMLEAIEEYKLQLEKERKIEKPYRQESLYDYDL